MKRQQLRQASLFISFLLFPVTIYYFSPVLIISGAVEGIAVGSFIVFSLMLLTALIFGRAFCGWLCPAGGMQEACFRINDKRAKGGKWDWVKYVIWLPWIVAIAHFFIQAGGITSFDLFYQTTHGISAVDPMSYTVFYAVVGLILILSIVAGRRAFCHYLCWMAPFMVLGRSIRNVLGLPALTLAAESTRCISCARCTKECPMSLDVQAMALRGNMEHAECVLCGTCTDVCPKGVIRWGIGARA